MAVKNSIQATTLLSINANTMDGSYKLIGVLSKPCFFIRIINASTKDITISYDGTNDADYCFSASSINVPAIFPQTPNTFYAFIPQGTPIYAKGAAGTGSINVAGYYQSQGA